MAEATALWELLRQTADPTVADALKTAVETGSDRSLNRINPLAFAAERGLNEEAAIGALVHAARLGVFDMSWNMLCPGCGGVLETAVALKSINRDHYFCAFCVQDNEPTLDQLVEVTFTVNPRIRRIGAHDPSSLSHAEYMRQIFWSSGAVVPEDIEGAIQRVTLDLMELQPGEKAAMSLTLPKGLVIAFDPVTHSTLFSRGRGRRDERAPQPVGRARRRACAFRLDEAPARPCAHHVREQIRPADAARPLGPQPGVGQSLQPPPAGADREQAPQQPDVPRSLSQRHVRSRAALQDHEPHHPLHRSQGLDRALRPGRRSRRLRSRAQPLRRASGGGRGRGRGGGQDDRRRGDGDLPDAGPGVARRDADAGGHAQDQRRSAAARTSRSTSACTRGRAWR